jgi:GAF domain-containing protein
VWRRDESVPDLTPEQRAWADENIFSAEDPLYAAALACHPSVYVDDVRTAARAVVNRDFEDRNFDHRALIHAHIVGDGELWGILQPCVFGRPREWTDADRELIEPLLSRLAPVVKAFVEDGRQAESSC